MYVNKADNICIIILCGQLSMVLIYYMPSKFTNDWYGGEKSQGGTTSGIWVYQDLTTAHTAYYLVANWTGIDHFLPPRCKWQIEPDLNNLCWQKEPDCWKLDRSGKFIKGTFSLCILVFNQQKNISKNCQIKSEREHPPRTSWKGRTGCQSCRWWRTTH